MIFHFSRRTDPTVIDAEYSLSDDGEQTTTPYTVDLDADQDEITLYPLDDLDHS